MLAYHFVKSFFAALVNGFPAQKMIIVGVTGTKGKTSVGNYVWSVLKHGGYNAGLLTSANFRIGDVEEINSYHMTMPGSFFIQNKLREMHERGVQIAVVEMTSEGMKQYRHFGIPVDIAIFTNLTPEHLNSHKGDFEVYKKAKNRMFKALNHANKKLGGKVIPTTIIANADSEHSQYYLNNKADQKITFGVNAGDLQVSSIQTTNNGTNFVLDNAVIHLSIPGKFNVYNALPALAVGQVLGISLGDIKVGLDVLKCIPGRMEMIDEGQDFTVIVDYAHEPASLSALLDSADNLRPVGKKIILLIGVIGGGRASRVPLTSVAAQKSDFLIITNEDPYDEDPVKMISELADTAIENGKQRGINLFTEIDRSDGIKKALALASIGDIVLITGKGAEQTMMTVEGAVPWNERQIVRSLTRAIATK